jgi:hypothetical protein
VLPHEFARYSWIIDILAAIVVPFVLPPGEEWLELGCLHVVDGLQLDSIVRSEERKDYAALSALRFMESWEIDRIKVVIDRLEQAESIELHTHTSNKPPAVAAPMKSPRLEKEGNGISRADQFAVEPNQLGLFSTARA